MKYLTQPRSDVFSAVMLSPKNRIFFPVNADFCFMTTCISVDTELIVLERFCIFTSAVLIASAFTLTFSDKAARSFVLVSACS